MKNYAEITTEETLLALGSSASGLSREEAARRMSEDGPNRLESHPPLSAWIILINQFRSFIIYLLLFAVAFSLLIEEYTDSLVILAILIMNGLIGFIQEFRANRSLESLKRISRVSARAVRDGRISVIDSEELVCGDIILLENGDKIPADARLLHSVELQLEESALTGESQPVLKQCSPLVKAATIQDKVNMVFSATTVVNGRGKAVVTACGMETEIGAISRMIHEAEDEKTPLQKRLDRFGRNLGMVIITICALVFILSISRRFLAGQAIDNRILLDFSFIAISLAVAAVPTALPAVVTIALSIGTRRLLAKNMLVRRLTSVETLGSCDVICSDKTGTLTRNQMTVQVAWTLDSELTLTGTLSPLVSTSVFADLFRCGLICNNSLEQYRESGHGNPTECALIQAADLVAITAEIERIAELPFDSGRKCMSILAQSEKELCLYSKGAPDQFIARCSHVATDTGILPMTQEHRKHIQAAYRRFGSEAMRVIAFGSRPAHGADDLEESGLIFLGLQAMIDPPRKDVASSIMRAGEAQIRVIMITGDHRETACALAHEIGIRGDCLTGAELDSMDETALTHALETVNIFARVIPEHKQRIVRSLQKCGHVVAMTGDGVNDAPALKKADIGIAVGSGTDVAQEASDFVLLDDSFTSIVDGVEQGRGIYDNIQKSIMLLLSGNLMEVLIIFVAVLIGFNLPLTALLLLWINLITDGAPALAYTVDPYGTQIMKRPPIPLDEGLLPRARLQLLIALGSIGALIGLGLFHIAGGNTTPMVNLEKAQTMVFNYIVLYEMLLVFVIRRSYSVPLFANIWLWVAVLFSLIMQGVIVYSPVNTLFHVVPLGIDELVQLAVATISFLLFCIGADLMTHHRTRLH